MRNLIAGLTRPVLARGGDPPGPPAVLARGGDPLGFPAVLARLRRDDRGAIGVLVAILLSAGVLTGLAALVVDVGQVYSERAQLQNGADAGALAVAKSCAKGACTPGAATTYANANSADGASAVNLVCGSGSLSACPPSTGALTDCPPAPPAGTNYVDVHTSTLTPSGSTLLPPVFAKTLLGNQNYNGTSVFACAQAEWGPPSASGGLAVTFSACEWDQATSNGTVFAPPPPYPPNPLPSPSLDQVLKLHTTSGTGCPTEPAGADGPGLFGWTTDPNNNCTTPIINGMFGGNTGTSISQACQAALSADQANRSLIFIPIYISVSGTGANGVYTLKGFAAFVITGYHMPGFTAKDWLNPANDCRGSSFCLNGYFTQGLVPTPGSIGGINLGADIITLTG